MSDNTTWTIRSAVSLVLLTFVGCGGPAYEYDSVVTGTVTIDGELAKSGTVTFHPVGDGRPAVGHIHPDGSYSLRTGQGDLQQVDGGTVMPGEYVVTVSITAPPAEGSVVAEGGPPIPGPSLIASKYAQKNTADLRRTVEPGPQVIVLNLDRAEPEPPADESAESASNEAGDEADPAEEAASPEAAQPAEDAPAEDNQAVIPENQAP